MFTDRGLGDLCPFESSACEAPCEDSVAEENDMLSEASSSAAWHDMEPIKCATLPHFPILAQSRNNLTLLAPITMSELLKKVGAVWIPDLRAWDLRRTKRRFSTSNLKNALDAVIVGWDEMPALIWIQWCWMYMNDILRQFVTRGIFWKFRAEAQRRSTFSGVVACNRSWVLQVQVCAHIIGAEHVTKRAASWPPLKLDVEIIF